MLSPVHVSIIVPCRNEVAFIAPCISSVLASGPVPGGFEVIVVDGMSSDGTRDILDTIVRSDQRVRVIDNPAGVVPAGMNAAIRAARGQIIVRLDAHAEYPADYLARCIHAIGETGAANVGGVVVTRARSAHPVARLVQAITTHRFGVGDSEFRLQTAGGRVDTVPFGCFHRDVFDQVGYYDERLVRNQDYELNRRIAASGRSIWLDPAIRATYYNQPSLRGLYRQASFTGMWNPWMWWVAPYSFAPRHTIPGVFVAVLLGLAAVAAFSHLGAWLLAGLLVAYGLCACASALQQASRHGWWMAPLLPCLFFAYHVSYGVGILWGILRLLVRATPVQRTREPWPGVGRYRAWPPPG